MALWRIRATVDDRPGYLSVLTASLALRSVNILAVQVHTTEAGAVDDFLVDAPDSMTETELLGAIAKGRGRDAFVARAEAQGLVDQPTRALALAGRLVHEPDTLAEALVTLLDATEVRWRPEPLTGRPGYDAARMTLADPAGGAFEVLRSVPAFTPAEYARAQALVELSGAMLRRHDERTTLLLPDGVEVVLRTATMDDLDGVRDLHARGSAASLQRRYLGSGIPTDARLARLIEPVGGGRTLLAVAGDRVVAMANLLTEGDLGEVAMLVDDDWQRRGLGTAMLRRLYAYAEQAHFSALIAHTAADNVAMLRTLRRLGGGPIDRDGTLVSVTLPIAGRSPAGQETPATLG
ncbi:GNAT family N-acetyltransferase [Paractinoplanes maris]|uniref:GNAT family N-acetyltransferase n=1 Tax=Paractinoplanes maris TaxID=1734446 RepID=UPI00201FDA4F|nr:GNAT family N-acetyltransferase [Actinoplanes maris]